MRPELLVCHGCRRVEPGTISLFTLERDGESLACQCGRKYAIVDGVAMLVELAEQGDVREHVSTYMDAHWGEGAARGARVFADKLEQLPRVPLAVELGCSAGRTLAALAARADHAVGIELQIETVRLAAALFAGKPVEYERRVVGDHYEPARVPPHPLANVTLACGDVLDPPLVPGAYDRVVALNMLDSVREPTQLLSVADALCAPGGELILSSPYSWQAGVAALGGADPAGYLRDRLRTGTDLRAAYELGEDTELPWTLRRDARSEVSYRVHYLRARKGT